MIISEKYRYELAKSLTELAIQNNMILRCEDSEATAKEVAIFFNTITESVGENSSNH